jgi:hypothetical protein
METTVVTPPIPLRDRANTTCQIVGGSPDARRHPSDANFKRGQLTNTDFGQNVAIVQVSARSGDLRRAPSLGRSFASCLGFRMTFALAFGFPNTEL